MDWARRTTLAKEHGLTNIAVLEKGWIGGGNTGRNTTIIRSNYLFDESAALYDHSVKLWENPVAGAQLQRHVLAARRDDARAHRARHAGLKRHVHANRCNGVDNEWLTPEQAKAFCPPLNIDDIRYPVLGARCSARRHRPARRGGLGLCARGRRARRRHHRELRSHRHPARCERRRRGGRNHARPDPHPKIGVSAAGHTSVVMKMAGVQLPLESFPLQALVSEPVKPIFPCVVMSNTIHAYISQSDKGELVIGAGTDAYTSYTQRGGCTSTRARGHLRVVSDVSPLRMLRNWGGIVDVTPDRSPIIAKTPVPGLYVNCGWGTGGFKATPGSAHVFAWTIARDEPHPINAPFTIERFRDGT
jgi:sarcosine oxidase subunit beta